MNRKGFAPIIMLVIVMILGAAVLGGVYLYFRNHDPAQTATIPTPPTVAPPQPPIPSITVKTTNSSTSVISGWKIYMNQQYGFQIQIPDYWMASEVTSTDPGEGVWFDFDLPNGTWPLIFVQVYPHGFKNFSEPPGLFEGNNKSFDFYIAHDPSHYPAETNNLRQSLLTFAILGSIPINPTSSTPKSVATSTRPQFGSASTNIPAGWTTYADNQVLFYQISYPQDWFLQNHGVDFVLGMTADTVPKGEPNAGMRTVTGPDIDINEYDLGVGMTLKDLYDGDGYPNVDFKNGCNTITFAGLPAYYCENIPDWSRRAIIFTKGNQAWGIFDDIANATSTKILSTFRFFQ